MSHVSNGESLSNPTSTTLVEPQGESDHSSQPEPAGTQYIEGVDSQPTIRDGHVLQTDVEAAEEASTPADDAAISHNDEMSEDILSSRSDLCLPLGEGEGATATERIHDGDIVQLADEEDMADANSNAADVPPLGVDEDVAGGEVGDLGLTGLAPSADMCTADDEHDIRANENDTGSDVNSEASGLWLDKAFIDSNWDSIAKGSNMANGLATSMQPTVNGNHDSPDWQPIETLSPVEAEEETSRPAATSSIAEGKSPAESHPPPPPGLSTDDATRRRHLDNCLDLIHSNNHTVEQVYQDVSNNVAASTPITQQSSRQENESEDSVSSTSSDHGPANVHQESNGMQRPKIMIDAFSNLEEIARYCQTLEDQLQTKTAEANLFKSRFYKREAEYLASKQLANDALKENAHLREEAGKVTSELLHWKREFSILADEKMPDSFHAEDLATKLRAEIQSRVKEAENAETELREAKRQHCDEMAKKDAEIAYHKKVAKIKRAQINRMMC